MSTPQPPSNDNRVERRKNPRVPVSYKVALAFSGGGTEGEGKLINISESGCAINGNKRIPESALLHLSIFPGGRTSPIVIQNAAVRWVRGWDFGLEFVNMTAEVRDEIRSLMQEIQAASASRDQAPRTTPGG